MLWYFITRRHPAAFLRCAQARVDTGWDGSAVRLTLRGPGGERARCADDSQVDQREDSPCRAGKQQVLGFLVGQVMKASRGKANPQQVNEALRKQLGTPSG